MVYVAGPRVFGVNKNMELLILGLIILSLFSTSVALFYWVRSKELQERLDALKKERDLLANTVRSYAPVKQLIYKRPAPPNVLKR